LADASGNIWSGQYPSTTLKGVLARIDTVSGHVLDTIIFDPIVLWSIFQAKPDELWCGTLKGLAFFNTQSKKVSYLNAPGFPELADANIVHIGRDRSGAIRLCSSTGFYKMTDEGKVAARYWSGGKGEQWLPFDDFYHFYQDTEGIFWLGTAGGGLLRWDTKTGEKRLLSRKNGLLNNYVYAVYEDDYGHLWLPTNLGIAQFDKNSLLVRRTWVTADGVAHDEFNRTSHFKAADGTLYFGGLNGVTSFHPKDFYANGTQAAKGSKNLVLSDFKLFSGATKKLENHSSELLASDKITLQPADRYFQLEFALLDYFSPKQVTYSYKIDGIDADWNILPEPLLRLSGLPYGTHRLKIRAQAADGTRADNELDYQLMVLKPVYLRWWFLLLSAGALVWAGFSLYRYQLNQRLAEKETQRLQQLDAFKTRFFTNVSHEFRTPLTVILGMTDTLNKNAEAGAMQKVKQSIEMIRRNSRQLLSLVNQLLDLAKLETGKMELTPANGDLSAFLRFQLESFRSYAESRQISLEFITDMPKLNMAFDAAKIQTIFSNLISNALKFTPDGGKIEVGLQTEPMPGNPTGINRVIMDVRDNGEGIAENELDKIFDRFYRVDDSTTRKSDGTGIGLALVQELVTLMKGKITVASTLGSGTVFQITLPFVPPDALPGQTEASPAPLNSLQTLPFLPEAETEEGNQEDLPLVLIVEDNPDVRFYIAETVRNAYRITTAENGAMGIQMARELVPDIIISDVMMPEKDGFMLCETLKNELTTSHIPIILLTARADFASRIAGLKRGADAYLAKPFEPTELQVQLANLVKLRRQLQQRYAGLPALPAEVPMDVAVQMEDAFLAKIREVVEENMQEPDFDVPELGREMGMSRSQLFRKVKALTGASPSILIRTIRLQKSTELLRNPGLTIAEIAYKVGFSSPAYYSTAFSELLGKTPGEFRKTQ
jgi:signal transduction histidine kinase/DNA-binding response OmpR family regulator